MQATSWFATVSVERLRGVCWGSAFCHLLTDAFLRCCFRRCFRQHSLFLHLFPSWVIARLNCNSLFVALSLSLFMSPSLSNPLFSCLSVLLASHGYRVVLSIHLQFAVVASSGFSRTHSPLFRTSETCDISQICVFALSYTSERSQILDNGACLRFKNIRLIKYSSPRNSS